MPVCSTDDVHRGGPAQSGPLCAEDLPQDGLAHGQQLQGHCHLGRAGQGGCTAGVGVWASCGPGIPGDSQSYWQILRLTSAQKPLSDSHTPSHPTFPSEAPGIPHLGDVSKFPGLLQQNKAVPLIGASQGALLCHLRCLMRSLDCVQFVDDVLDFTGSTMQLGKPTLNDLRSGLATAPVLYAAEEHPELNTLILRRFKSEGEQPCVATVCPSRQSAL